MVHKKNLIKGNEYIYFYAPNWSPLILRFVGKNTNINSSLEFETLNGDKVPSPRLNELYDPFNTNKEKLIIIMKSVFTAQHESIVV